MPGDRVALVTGTSAATARLLSGTKCDEIRVHHKAFITPHVTTDGQADLAVVTDFYQTGER